MKMKKIVLGILFSYMFIFMFPVRVCFGSSGNLSGVGILASEEEEKTLDIYQVTLPSGNDLGIVLDPEGLLSISKKGEYDSSWAGKIHMKEDGGAVFINRSSFPVSIQVGISVDQDNHGTPTSIPLLDSDEFVDDGVWPQMYLTATPGAAKIKTMDGFVPSDFHIPVLSKDQKMTEFSFLLDAAEYSLDEKTGEYKLKEYDGNYDSASFVLDGRVNKNADWSAYTGSMRERVVIHAVYTIKRQSVYNKEKLYQAKENERAPYALMGEGD